MTYTEFVLYCGYVESQSLASITFGHNTGFDDVLEAMESIRRICLDLSKPHPNRCCKGVKTNYCPKCGKPVVADGGANLDHIAAEFFRELWDESIDSATENGILEAFEAEGWDISGYSSNRNSTTVVDVDQWIEHGGKLNHHMEWTTANDSESTYDRKKK